jgi:hypothetical protein
LVNYLCQTALETNWKKEIAAGRHSEVNYGCGQRHR